MPTLFIAEPDLGNGSECSIFAQDCPPGLKCMPWVSDSDSPYAWGCRPVADDPVGVGQTCHVEGSALSGLDDYEVGAMCWDVNPDTAEGTCVPLCVGDDSGEWPFCEDPDRQCTSAAEVTDILFLCLPTCDPLQQDCPQGVACQYIQGIHPEGWTCSFQAPGDMGAYGDPCEPFISECDPGLVCLDAAAVPPGCGASNCCTEICDLFDPLGDMQCTGAAEGQQCLPWYEPDQAPPGNEDVGVCALP